METKVRKTKERKLAVEKPSKIDERNFKMRKEAINIRDENKLFFFLLPHINTSNVCLCQSV